MTTIKQRHKVLTMLFFLSVLTYLDRVCLAVAAPKISEELGLRPGQIGLIFSAFVLAYGLLEVPSGWMGDRFGPRITLTRIVVWWSAFVSITGLIRSYIQLLVCQFLFGAGEAGAYPNASCAISRWFPFRERARAQGTVWMASRIGGALAPWIVLPLQNALGWRSAFLVLGVFGVLWVIPWYVWFRDYPQQKKGVSQAELAEIGEPAPSAHVSLGWKRALGSGNLWAVMLMYHTFCYGSWWFISWMPTFLVKAKGITAFATYAALPFIFGAIANVLGGYASDFLVGKIGLKWGRRAVGLISMGTAGGFLILSLVFENKALCIVTMALSFGASDFMLPNCWAVCLDIGKRYAGTVSGAMNMAGQMGAFISSGAFGFLVQRYGWNLPLVGLGCLFLTSGLIWLKIDATKLLVPEKEAVAAHS